MPAGTHYLLAGGVTKTHQTYGGSGRTHTSGVIFGQDVILKSIVTRFSSAGSWSGRVVIWNVDTSTKIFDEDKVVEQASQSNDLEIVLTNPPRLTAGVIYRIGFYNVNAAACYPSYLSTSGSVSAFTSTPSGMVANQSGGDYSFWSSGDTMPTSGIGYWSYQGLYVDFPNEPPTVSNLTSSSLNPLMPFKFSWQYNDPDGNAQTKYQIGYRAGDSLEGYYVHEVEQAVSHSSYGQHEFPAGTFEEDKTYDFWVRVYDGKNWSERASSTITAISPHRVDTAINLATAAPGFVVLGSATVDNNYSWNDSTWTRIAPTTTNHGGRKNIPFSLLRNGSAYTVALTLANPTASSITVNVDFCDSLAMSAQTLAANEVRRVVFSGTPSLINETYRFIDVATSAGSVVLVKDVCLIQGNNRIATYFDGNTTDTNSTRYYWLGAENASPSAKEVFAYENILIHPSAETSPGWLSNNSASWTNSKDTTVKRSGNQSTKVINKVAGGGFVSTYAVGQPTAQDCTPGETLSFGVWIRPTNSGRAASAHLAFYTPTLSGVVQSIPGPSTPLVANEWNFVKIENIIVPSGAGKVYTMVTGSSGLLNEESWLDDAIMVRDTPLPDYFDGNDRVEASAHNLITNPSFEENTTGITATRVTLTRSDSWASSGSFSVNAQRTTDTNPDAYIDVAGLVEGGVSNLKPNTTYTLAGTYYLPYKFDNEAESGNSLVQRISLFVRLNGINVGWTIGKNKDGMSERLRLVFTTPASFDGENSIRLYCGGMHQYTVPTTVNGTTYYTIYYGEYIYWDDVALYEGDVETYDATRTITQWTGTPNASTSLFSPYGVWRTPVETTSATAAGVLNATTLEAGDYELSIRVQDSTGNWSDWGPVETFNLTPASNIQVKRAGTWTTGVEYVKKNGIWVQASPTKRKSGGTWV